jgi:hypothetical protein
MIKTRLLLLGCIMDSTHALPAMWKRCMTYDKVCAGLHVLTLTFIQRHWLFNRSLNYVLTIEVTYKEYPTLTHKRVLHTHDCTRDTLLGRPVGAVQTARSQTYFLTL